jgi:hypothetical protein
MCADYARDRRMRVVHNAPMDVEWFRQRKRELKITDQAIAEAIGRERSVANRIINGGVAFDFRYADGLARVFQVDRMEILRRAGLIDVIPEIDQPATIPPPNGEILNMEKTSDGPPHQDLPIYGTALGSAREIEGEAIEQTTLNRAEVMQYVKRPSILHNKPGSYALHVQGSSMHPALPDGELIAASSKMPVRIGDNVVVFLRANGDDDDGVTARAVLVKELVRRTASYVELRQYTPPRDFRIPMDEVLRIDHVLSREEMLR